MVLGLFLVSLSTANARDEQLAADIAAHNAKCSNVQPGSQQAAQCQQDAAVLKARIAASK
jgi:hypothetical protein